MPLRHPPCCTFSIGHCTSGTRLDTGEVDMETSPRRRRCGRCSRGGTCGCGSTTVDGLDPGALDRPVRWVHSSDLADPTPFLSEGLVLLTTGTQFEDVGDSARPLPRLRPPARRPAAWSGSASAPKWCAPASHPPSPTRAATSGCRCSRCRIARRSSPSRAPTPRRSPPRRTRAAAGRSPRSGRSPSRRSARTASGATLAELARQLDTWVGMFDAAGELVREHPVGGLDARGGREPAHRGGRGAAPRRARRLCHCGSATRPSPSRPSAEAATCAGSSRWPPATSTRRAAASSPR